MLIFDLNLTPAEQAAVKKELARLDAERKTREAAMIVRGLQQPERRAVMITPYGGPSRCF